MVCGIWWVHMILGSHLEYPQKEKSQKPSLAANLQQS